MQSTTVYSTKRGNPFAILGYLLGGLLLTIAAFALLTAWFIVLESFLDGAPLGTAFLVTVAGAAVWITIEILKWVNQ